MWSGQVRTTLSANLVFEPGLLPQIDAAPYLLAYDQLLGPWSDLMGLGAPAGPSDQTVPAPVATSPSLATVPSTIATPLPTGQPVATTAPPATIVV